MTFVNEFMVVESTDVMVLDFDNYVFDKDKRMLGFVADVFGPVEKPYYAIRLQST
jgi:rRNA processing protein Gar1